MSILLGLVATIFNCTLQAHEQNRNEKVRGIFIRQTEVKVGDEGYMGIFVKPFDSDDHIIVLVTKNHRELAQTAQRMEEGTRLGISFVTEDGHKFIRSIEAEMRREKRQEEPEEEKQIIIRREIRRETSEGIVKPKNRRSRGVRREPERIREREHHQDRRHAVQQDKL